jgi:ATP-dependent Clp protease ATP-binding subunit ClpA
VGYEEGGYLTEKVRRRPYSVVLFDEIEKAHPDVFNMLLQVLDDGRLTDSVGHVVDFKNTILIMTSNLGTGLLGKRTAPGFLPEADATTYERMKERVLEELKRSFRPEFINRIDEIVPFYPLLFEDIRTMLKLNLREMSDRLKEKGIRLRVFQGAYEFLAEQGYSPEYGARELRRTVERLVMNPISARVLEGMFKPGDTIEVLVEGNDLTFRKGETLLEQKVIHA